MAELSGHGAAEIEHITKEQALSLVKEDGMFETFSPLAEKYKNDFKADPLGVGYLGSRNGKHYVVVEDN